MIGDFAFIFYDSYNKKFAIAKDYFGKKSLLLGFHKNGFLLSSCSINPKCKFNAKQNENN